MTAESVKGGLTPKPPAVRGRAQRARVVENGAYTAFCGRAIRSAGRRIADGDIDALTDLTTLAVEVDDAVTTAVTGLRAFGYSWAQIAERLGVTRQAAHQRWGGGPS